MAKKDYTEDPPANFGKIFIKACWTCADLSWTGLKGYVCDRYNFRFFDVDHDPLHSVCGSWEVKQELLDQWKKQ